MIQQAKRKRKNIRRDNLRVLYKTSNIATMRDIKVSKFTPSQPLVNGELVWTQYQLLKNDESNENSEKIRAEVAINKNGEAEVAVFCDKGYLSDLTYVCADADKRVKARLALLKKQLRYCEER